jgi:hypothetical protein
MNNNNNKFYSKDNADNNEQIIESGDIFFFYRPKIETEEVKGIEDVQRFYMIMSQDISSSSSKDNKKDKNYRLFLLGRKKMPEIVKGKSTSEERNWALNILCSSNSEEIHNELLSAEYSTKTKGKRRIAAAQPAGEGKYSIIKHDGHTELAYILEIPEVPGPTQTEFEIKKEVSYIVSVKNPDIVIPGYEVFSKKSDDGDGRKPNYPKHIRDKFGENKRWINVDDSEILDYENTQLLLIGARKRNVEEELGIEIDEEKEDRNSADIFKELKIRKEEVPLQPFLKGKFPKEEEIPMSSGGIKELSSEKAPGVKGGQKGGKIAATKSTSAAAIAKMISGITLPMTKKEIVKFANNKIKSKSTNVEDVDNEILDILNELPEKIYHKITDIEKEVGKIR